MLQFIENDWKWCLFGYALVRVMSIVIELCNLSMCSGILKGTFHDYIGIYAYANEQSSLPLYSNYYVRPIMNAVSVEKAANDLPERLFTQTARQDDSAVARPWCWQHCYQNDSSWWWSQRKKKEREPHGKYKKKVTNYLMK